MAQQLRCPRLLERHVVVGGEAVDVDNPLASLQEPLRDVKPDKPGGAG